jgi:putative methyltransferase (TIGR04325 family)
MSIYSKFLRDLVPPVLLSQIDRIRSSTNSRSYSSYEQALLHSSSKGYQTDDVVKVVVEKTKLLFQQTAQQKLLDLGSLRTVAGLGLSKKQNLTVLDYGGGAGYHFRVADIAFGGTVNLNWAVVETHSMAQLAQKELSQPNLTFLSDLTLAKQLLGNIDLVFTSGTLHCTDDPLARLRDLLSLNPSKLFITRTCFNDSSSTKVFIQKSRLSQNGPGPLPEGFKDRDIFYPNVIVPISDIRTLIEESGYSIRFQIVEDRGVCKSGSSSFNMYGLFCEKPESRLDDLE